MIRGGSVALNCDFSGVPCGPPQTLDPSDNEQQVSPAWPLRRLLRCKFHGAEWFINIPRVWVVSARLGLGGSLLTPQGRSCSPVSAQCLSGSSLQLWVVKKGLAE